MISFMFGVLFTVTFWAIYLPASFIITIMIFKAVVPRWLYPITKGIGPRAFDLNTGDWVILSLQFVGCVIFWPIVIVAAIVWKLLTSFISKLILGLIRRAITAIPTISITFGNEDSKKKEISPNLD